MRDMVVEIEDRRAESHGTRLLWLAVGVGVVTGVLTLAFVPQVILAIPLPVPFANPIKFLALMILTALGCQRLLERLMPARRRFPELVQGRAVVALPKNLRAVPRSTWIVVGGIVGVSVLAAILVPLLSAYLDMRQVQARQDRNAAYRSLDECNRTGRQCQAELADFYQTVRDRSADLAMRLLLEDKLGCAEQCDAELLGPAMTEINNLAIDLGLRTPAVRPNQSYRPTRD